MAARSVIATFTNSTSATLTLSSAIIQHGQWDTEPPGTIAPGATVSWASESAGLLTGTQVQVVYNMPAGDVVTTYDNPFVGSNGATITYPQKYLGVAQISDGQNATATYTIAGG